MNKIIALFFILTLWCAPAAFAQFGEPEVKDSVQPRSLFQEGYKFGFGFHIALNDFGFGGGGQFRFGLANYSEATITFKMAGLKDPSELTFTDFYYGGRITPEKYRRVVAFPLYFGYKKRFFARQISDNFRVFAALSAGPVFAWSFDYFNDLNGNGFRENDIFIYGNVEPVYDIFSGWKNSQTHWGAGGELVLGIDFGDNFANLNSVQFGYAMKYFDKGIQIMEPNKNIPLVTNGEITGFRLEPAHDPTKYFGSAQISFVFGWMW